MDLGIFYEKYRTYYYWKLSGKMSSAGLPYHAEDIIHDVIVGMIANEKRRAKFECLTEKEARAYFMTCLTHRMVDLIRREQRGQEFLRLLEQSEREETVEVCSAENSVIKRLDEADGIAEILNLLTEQERELVNLVFIQKLSYHEVARRSRVREHAIAMRILRLKKKIWKLYIEKNKRHTKKEFGSCKPEKLVLS